MRKSDVTLRRALPFIAAAVIGFGITNIASAVDWPEVEPNNDRASATPVGPLSPGDTISGSSTGSTADPDYFNVTTQVMPLAIYRHQIDWNAGTVFGRIQGYTQAGGVINPASNTTVQLNPGSAPFENVWYGFGKGETTPMFLNHGTANPAYVGTYSRTTVTPIAGPSNLLPGNITISSVGQTTADTDLWVYDSNFNAMLGYGNDDSAGTAQSTLTRSYAPGTYYVAISLYNLANDQASPGDDQWLSGPVLSYPDSVANSSTAVTGNLSFTMTDSNGQPIPVTVARSGRFGVEFVQFTVVPEPATMSLLALGLPVLMRRRRS